MIYKLLQTKCFAAGKPVNCLDFRNLCRTHQSCQSFNKISSVLVISLVRFVYQHTKS